VAFFHEIDVPGLGQIRHDALAARSVVSSRPAISRIRILGSRTINKRA
jgi:hypothetical protein